MEIGVFKEGNYHVLEFGFSEGIAPELVVSPGHQDIYAPTLFDGHEEPDPMRIHSGNAYPVGYPIMAMVNGPGVQKVNLIEAELKDEIGAAVPFLINSPDKDDHLDTEVILMPTKPLQLDMTYQARVKLTATMKDGTIRQFDKNWSFRTEPKVGLGVLKLHKDAVSYAIQQANFGLNHSHTVTFGLSDDNYKLDMISFPMKQNPRL
ncbi:hypothetical protein GK047_08845 [Paenibacillus sp. SYP-B3998]|uniref:Uncharacterized protein n=1 Tax=Paenibacillus sp. SYP-B3998 TaxID=2678564 RepID=A0A6G3ZVH8_9BACL|nr:hypothetical protein [Paenibacillus sp. SYP-B3998]NEW06115.1 hypothetical protein [Paenibacillus sp. SYP-B3998]